MGGANLCRRSRTATGEPGDIEMLDSQARLLDPGNTFCALAPGAMEPLQSALKYFRDDFERHITREALPLEMSTEMADDLHRQQNRTR